MQDDSVKNTPLISIITVTYNAGASLERTILSVIDQSYQNIQYIIIDGGSKDNTVDIIKKYEDKISYWVSEPDKGIYDAMNKSIDVAKGEWVYFLGAGDTLMDILHEVAGHLNKPDHIYYGNVYREDLQRIYDGKYSAFKLAVVNICHQAIFYPLSALKKHRYNTRYKLLADHDLNMRCWGDKDYQFEYIPVTISNYEGGGVSAAQPDVEFFKDKIDVIRQNFPFMVYLYAYLRRSAARLIKKTDQRV